MSKSIIMISTINLTPKWECSNQTLQLGRNYVEIAIIMISTINLTLITPKWECSNQTLQLGRNYVEITIIMISTINLTHNRCALQMGPEVGSIRTHS
jgi:hypothetical protein